LIPMARANPSSMILPCWPSGGIRSTRHPIAVRLWPLKLWKPILRKIVFSRVDLESNPGKVDCIVFKTLVFIHSGYLGYQKRGRS
jgi:hypothetical protein